MRFIFSFVAVLFAALLTGCATTAPPDLQAFKEAAPKSILVVPAINKTLDVDAPNYLLSTLTVPLAEKGYYVFPVNTAKMVLEQEGLYEGEQIHAQSPETLTKMFNADAVLYVTINRWDAQYLVIDTKVTVDFDYRIAFKDGTEIWKTNEHIRYSPQDNFKSEGSIGLLIKIASAAMERAAPNYLPLTQQANGRAFVSGSNPIPNGPHRKTEK